MEENSKKIGQPYFRLYKLVFENITGLLFYWRH